jgi:hypothetical protein
MRECDIAYPTSGSSLVPSESTVPYPLPTEKSDVYPKRPPQESDVTYPVPKVSSRDPSESSVFYPQPFEVEPLRKPDAQSTSTFIPAWKGMMHDKISEKRRIRKGGRSRDRTHRAYAIPETQNPPATSPVSNESSKVPIYKESGPREWRESAVFHSPTPEERSVLYPSKASPQEADVHSMPPRPQLQQQQLYHQRQAMEPHSMPMQQQQQEYSMPAQLKDLASQRGRDVYPHAEETASKRRRLSAAFASFYNLPEQASACSVPPPRDWSRTSFDGDFYHPPQQSSAYSMPPSRNWSDREQAPARPCSTERTEHMSTAQKAAMFASKSGNSLRKTVGGWISW